MKIFSHQMATFWLCQRVRQSRYPKFSLKFVIRMHPVRAFIRESRTIDLHLQKGQSWIPEKPIGDPLYEIIQGKKIIIFRNLQF